ncbi:hypothetical protein PIB30_007284 [Stylosanthes scabra]|uniref:Uncharacterized protein n=1 Tax=Stylosanthes scabra TaxID=79078 RepID=A0ABU6W2M6_9FABA|nr:hypothetical protein [Stylosanthes scabra]
MALTTVIGLKQCEGFSKAVSYDVKAVVTEKDKATDGTSKGDADKDFVEKLEDWDSKNRQSITWF